jgi:hypothetical protein
MKRLAAWFVAGCAGVGALIVSVIEIEQWHLRRARP